MARKFDCDKWKEAVETVMGSLETQLEALEKVEKMGGSWKESISDAIVGLEEVLDGLQGALDDADKGDE